MRSLALFIAVVMPIAVGKPVSAQNPVVRSGSATTYVCPKCGKLHYRQPVSASPASPASATTSPAEATAASPTTVTVRKVSYETAVAGAAPMASTSTIQATGGVSNVMGALNAQRARRGIRALLFDPSLQAVAQRRAQRMASSGLKNHPPGSFSPGRYEGVGWSSSYSPSGVSACFTSDTRMRYAGAAMATGRDGVYFAVVYR